jgi:hypothetical protein
MYIKLLMQGTVVSYNPTVMTTGVVSWDTHCTLVPLHWQTFVIHQMESFQQHLEIVFRSLSCNLCMNCEGEVNLKKAVVGCLITPMSNKQAMNTFNFDIGKTFPLFPMGSLTQICVLLSLHILICFPNYNFQKNWNKNR